MSFTGTDLKTLAEAEIDDTLENTDVVQNVNACLLEFTEEFRKTATQVITVTDTSSFTNRTDGHLSVVKITDSDDEDYSGEWELNHDRTQIRIGETGTFTVTSIITPVFIAAVTDTVGVNDAYKLGLARYIGACFKLKDNDQNPDGLRMKLEAAALIRRASSLLTSSDRRPGMRVPIERSGGKWTELDSLK
jgi:hypothetical protein